MGVWWLIAWALVGSGAQAVARAEPVAEVATARAGLTLSAALTQALRAQNLPPGALSQPHVDAPQSPRLFQHFMTTPERAWADVDALVALPEARPHPGDLLRVMRQLAVTDDGTAKGPPHGVLPAATVVPPHIPQPLAGELRRALQALALAEAWRLHALRRLPDDVSPTALLASALPSAVLAGEPSAVDGPSSWRTLAPLVDLHALHTGARIALAAAQQLHAFVLQHPDLPPVAWHEDTPAGTVLVDTTGAANHHVVTHPLLLLDVGGDDRYTLGGDRPAPQPGVRLLIDHGGNDRYQARAPGGGASSALMGYGILWDTEGDDHHDGGWLAQGAALLGVALHIDDAGDNRLQATGLAQGFAIGGTALLLSSPGKDQYRAQTLAQASAGPQGLALLLDPGGDDHYHLGTEVLVWPSAQLPDRNASLGQGAGFGPPGGVALLVDASGDDRYEADVFAQGAGLRQGTGLLLDQGGHNHFQAAWYAMGAAAHQGVGLLWTSAVGDDQYEVSHVTSMGTGHDASIGMLVDAGGRDEWQLQDLGLGASHDGGHGVLVHGPGPARFQFTGTAGRGMGRAYTSKAGSPSGGLGVFQTIATSGRDTLSFQPPETTDRTN